jgi:hypothetical protein
MRHLLILNDPPYANERSFPRKLRVDRMPLQPFCDTDRSDPLARRRPAA